MDAEEARRELYAIMNRDGDFEEKARQALALGETYLGVDNAHLTRIHPESDYWKATVSTDPPDGDFPAGVVLDLQTTFCRHVVDAGESVAFHDAPAAGVIDGGSDDPTPHCYHGTPVSIDGELYGTVCFVSRDAREKPFADEETTFAELVARMLEHELQRERTSERIDRLQRFASVLSHDIRNPLNVAVGRVEMAREERDSEHLRTAVEALTRMRELVDDVLTMARQGQTVEGTEPVRLASVAEECWGSVATGDATLRVDGDLAFRAAPDRLKHLFENLIRNAVEHSSAGSQTGSDDAVEHGSTSSRTESDDAVEHSSTSNQTTSENAVEHGGQAVTVRIGPLDDGDGFYVEDDGPGIPPADRDAVFETGYTTGTEGLGLGLALVDGVASAHGWTVAVVEGSAGGARFEVRDVVVVDPGDG